MGALGTAGSMDSSTADWSISPDVYRAFCSFLQGRCGIVLGAGKEYLIRSRLVSLLPRYDAVSMDQLLDKVIRGDNLSLERTVIDAMTTNETFWFRDVYPFEILGSRILPELVRERRRIRIWSAACSSGQEPYSIAMVIREQAERIADDVMFLDKGRILECTGSGSFFRSPQSAEGKNFLEFYGGLT